jgi:hypothetical protein
LGMISELDDKKILVNQRASDMNQVASQIVSLISNL